MRRVNFAGRVARGVENVIPKVQHQIPVVHQAGAHVSIREAHPFGVPSATLGTHLLVYTIKREAERTR